MATAAKHRLTPLEYLAIERKAGFKSEFVDGEMFAMAGGTRRHSAIAANCIRLLGNAIQGASCQALTSDLRVKVEATGLYAYPDVTVARGDLRFEDDAEDVLLNPKVIIEVLSESTAAWDRGRKFWHYRHLDSLSDYVLVSQDGWLVEHYNRQPDATWRLESLDQPGSSLHLKSIQARLPLADIYANTGLKPGVPPPDNEPEPPKPTRKRR